MHNGQITIVISAYKIRDDNVAEFVDRNRAAFEAVGVDLLVVSDRELLFEVPWAWCLVYPKEQEKFSLPKTINYGLKRVGHGGVIVKSDVDIIFSKEALEYVRRTVTDKQGVVCLCVDIKNPSQASVDVWNKTPKRAQGRGACFALSQQSWFVLNGYNENIFGWGADDNDMWTRANRRQKMVCCRAYPLFHVIHQDRKSKVSGSFFEFRSKQNMIISRRGWSNSLWGEAL